MVGPTTGRQTQDRSVRWLADLKASLSTLPATYRIRTPRRLSPTRARQFMAVLAAFFAAMFAALAMWAVQIH